MRGFGTLSQVAQKAQRRATVSKITEPQQSQTNESDV
jgi:hypothetical protein